MKKIIFLLTLVVSFAIVSGYKQTTSHADSKDVKSSKKIEAKIPTDARESVTSVNPPDGKPKILLLLTNTTGMSKWSPSLWWKYEHASKGQPGC